MKGIGKMRNQKTNNKFISLFSEHIINNIREYIIVIIFLLIGVVIGAIFINNISQDESMQIKDYLSNFITALKTDYQIDKITLLKQSVTENIILATAIWFAGACVIGIPVVYAIVTFRGFCLGYTISALAMSFGSTKAIVFALLTILLQNIVFIPAILAESVSVIKLYKSIMKDRRKENIKLEILKHTIFSLFILIAFILSSIIEVYISNNILMIFINYF